MKRLGLFMLLLFVSCKFNVSPYSAETAETVLNEVNLNRIQAEEGNVGNSFKIALISDTHNYYDELERLIKTINARGPFSFVIVAGDITNLGLLEEYHEARRHLNKLKWPYLVAPGNHDLVSNGAKIFRKMFGPDQFAFEYKGVKFIIFNNNNWEAGGAVPDTAWVQRELASTSAPFKVLVAHVPPTDKDRFPQAMIDQWESIITMNGVDYFINGHNHNSSDASFGSGINITVGAPSKGNYFELLIDSGGIDHQKVSF